MVISSLDTRPREERDFKEFYGDLDETDALPVVAVGAKPARNSAQPHAAPQITHAAPISAGYVKRTRAAPQLARVSKPVAEYGFRTKLARPGALQTHIRPHLAPKQSKLVRYDMDEQDVLFLAWRNAQHKVAVLREAFEIAMTVLEHEWHQLELQMTAVAGPGSDNRAELTLVEDYEKYGSDDGSAGALAITEQRCAVCNDLECDNTNAIVFCDGCNIAVHQECYGIAFIPEGQWFCRKCMVNRGSAVACTFCPSMTGAFKQLDNGLWSHVVCALWIPEVYFANPVYMEPIEGVNLIPRNRWKLLCYICKQRMGACVQCANRLCFLAYHVTCAKRAGLYMAMERGVQGAIALKALLKSYCDRHTPHEWDRDGVLYGIHRTRMFYRDRRLLNQQNDRLALQRRQENRENSFKWKTENSTPIAPQKFVAIVADLLRELKTGEGAELPDGRSSLLRGLGNTSGAPLKKELEDEIAAASASLCKYWCLKREAKRGAPLVRWQAPNPALTSGLLVYDAGAKNVIEIVHKQLQEKILFGHTLMRDVQKLIQLSQMTLERQQKKRASDSATFGMVDTAYFPLMPAGMRHVAYISERMEAAKAPTAGRTHAQGSTLQEIATNVAQYRYTGSAVDLDNAVQGLLSQIARTAKPGSAAARAAARSLEYWQTVAKAQLEHIDATQDQRIPFVAVEGLNFSLKPHDARAILAEEALSETGPMSEADQQAWWNFITD